ncbi:hypothetical protein KGA65_15320 [Ideonella sp. B7]|uniref:hypothetical protein n=1 Tax=Ideonella benzenivorans TaxID=2831643 RepID=UPI001CED1DE6|nr:hypothetical protein [Ideonella benzenivorans]MCA6217903.1 hypothetical protein [Ideonella benzenivorans]
MSCPEATAWTQAHQRARQHLLREAEAGFPEAGHRMTFPHQAGFGGAREQHEGRVFSLAILGGLLLDAAEALGGDPALQALATGLAEQVAAQRLADCAGGWSYFPDLPELPPDLDTLAAVLSLLARAAPQHLPLAAPALALARQQRTDEGCIPTFLMSDADPPARREAMQRGVRLHWGHTADADVLARFYTTMWRLDADTWGPSAPLDWLAAQQAADGAWRTPWYAGAHYPTRLVLDLFEALAPQAPAAQAARDFLRQSPPPTSALDLAVTGTPGTALLALQQDDGAWPASPWLQMPMGRPQGQVVRVLSWTSRTLTTAHGLRRAAQEVARRG